MHSVSSQASFLSSNSSSSSLSSSLSASSHGSQDASGLSVLLAASPRAAADSGVSPSYSYKMKTFAAAAKIAADGYNMGVIHTLKPRPEYIQGVAYTESQAKQSIPSYFEYFYTNVRLNSQALDATDELPRRDECLVELTTLLAGEIPEDTESDGVIGRFLERSDSNNAMYELEGNRFFG